MKTRKKLLSIILTLAMAITMVPAFAVPASAEPGENKAKIGETEYISIQAAVEAAGTTPTAIMMMI